MKDWKNIKDKEIIIGLIVIIILGIIALCLLIRREVNYQKKQETIVANENYVEEQILEKEIFEGISCEDEQTFVRVLKLVYSRLLDKRNELDKA